MAAGIGICAQMILCNGLLMASATTIIVLPHVVALGHEECVCSSVVSSTHQGPSPATDHVTWQLDHLSPWNIHKPSAIGSYYLEGLMLIISSYTADWVA